MLNTPDYYNDTPSADDLRAMPTICTSQADDLKIDTGNTRVWLSRATVDDGALFNDMVTFERWNGDRWRVCRTYQG